MGEGEKNNLMRLGDVVDIFVPPIPPLGTFSRVFLHLIVSYFLSLCFVSAEVCFSNLFFIFQSFLHHKAKEHWHRRYNMFQ